MLSEIWLLFPQGCVSILSPCAPNFCILYGDMLVTVEWRGGSAPLQGSLWAVLLGSVPLTICGTVEFDWKPNGKIRLAISEREFLWTLRFSGNRKKVWERCMIKWLGTNRQVIWFMPTRAGGFSSKQMHHWNWRPLENVDVKIMNFRVLSVPERI